MNGNQSPMSPTDRKTTQLIVSGLPGTVPEADAAVCRSRLLKAATELTENTDTTEFALVVGTSQAVAKLLAEANGDARQSADNPSPAQYSASPPLYTFDQLIVPDHVKQELIAALNVLNVETLVFDTWGLREIEPFPRAALNFHGLPGTGKTLAAHAIAERMGRKILIASYAEIESKFHGDGPKNVKALFAAAEQADAVLFIDEADSLLSRRLTNVTQGSEQAINSMRSQLLICLEQFSGIVVFSTNLVENYDKAFETRVRHVRFELPDEICRAAIWGRHLLPNLPIAKDVDIGILARRIDDVCGRDIKNAVIDAAVRAAVRQATEIPLADFVAAIGRIKQARVEPTTSLIGKPAAEDVEQRILAAVEQDRHFSSSNDRPTY